MVTVHYHPTFGSPNDALVTPGDNGYVLVSVSGVDVCHDESCAGVQVFKKSDFTNPCGGQEILYFPRPTLRGEAVQSVDGCNFFPARCKSVLVPRLRSRVPNFFVWLV